MPKNTCNPVLIIDTREGLAAPVQRAPKESPCIVVIHENPTLRQAWQVFWQGLSMLVKSAWRTLYRYCQQYNRGYTYVTHWYTQETFKN